MHKSDTLGGIPRPQARRLTAVTVPAGIGGVRKLNESLRSALDGTGPAIIPVPEGPEHVVSAIMEACKPDDANFPLESDDIAVVVATSGSTGTPRGVLLTADALVQSAQAFGARFGTDARWVVSMPVHRIAGLMVLTRSWLHDSPFEIDPSIGGARPFDAPTFYATTMRAKRLSDSDGRRLMVSLVPTQIARLIEAGPVGLDALRAYDVVLSGAAATPQPLLDTLRHNDINVVVSYGMSETCGGCAFDGQPLDGVTISLATSDEEQPGRISISGGVIASGYRLRPDVDALTFVGGRMLTHDVGKLDSAGLLHVLGRLDDVVTVGGVNVALSAVEALIRHHPQVQEVAIVDVTDATWGSLPIAYIVLQDVDVSVSQLTQDLSSVVAERIGKAATPREFFVVPALPMLDSGKVDRLTLRLKAAHDLLDAPKTHH